LRVAISAKSPGKPLGPPFSSRRCRRGYVASKVTGCASASGKRQASDWAARLGDQGALAARHFAPTQPAGVPRGNWIQTDPKKGWFTILRVYSPLESFFDRSWRPREIELVK